MKFIKWYCVPTKSFDKLAPQDIYVGQTLLQSNVDPIIARNIVCKHNMVVTEFRLVKEKLERIYGKSKNSKT